MAIPIFPFFPEMLNGIGPEREMRFREVQSANRSVKNMPIFVKHLVDHQHFAPADGCRLRRRGSEYSVGSAPRSQGSAQQRSLRSCWIRHSRGR